MFLKELIPSFEWINRLRDNKTNEFFIAQNYLLLCINLILILLISWMIIEGAIQFKDKLKNKT